MKKLIKLFTLILTLTLTLALVACGGGKNNSDNTEEKELVGYNSVYEAVELLGKAGYIVEFTANKQVAYDDVEAEGALAVLWAEGMYNDELECEEDIHAVWFETKAQAQNYFTSEESSENSSLNFYKEIGAKFYVRDNCAYVGTENAIKAFETSITVTKVEDLYGPNDIYQAAELFGKSGFEIEFCADEELLEYELGIPGAIGYLEAYYDEGEEACSAVWFDSKNSLDNFKNSGWFDELENAGYQVKEDDKCLYYGSSNAIKIFEGEKVTLGGGNGGGNTDDSDIILVDVNASFAPCAYYDENEIEGVEIDIMNMVGEKLDKEVVFVNTGFDVIIDNVANGDYDCGASGLTITPSRLEMVDFSNVYYTSELYVLYRTDNANVTVSTASDGVSCVFWDDLMNMDVGVQLNTCANYYADIEMYGDGDYVGELQGTTGGLYSYDNSKIACDALSYRDVDVVILDKIAAEHIYGYTPGFECKPLYYDGEIEDEKTEDSYAICVTKGNDDLLDAINAVLAELGEQGIRTLVFNHLALGN